jgi:hypothetical protein
MLVDANHSLFERAQNRNNNPKSNDLDRRRVKIYLLPESIRVNTQRGVFKKISFLFALKTYRRVINCVHYTTCDVRGTARISPVMRYKFYFFVYIIGDNDYFFVHIPLKFSGEMKINFFSCALLNDFRYVLSYVYCERNCSENVNR